MLLTVIIPVYNEIATVTALIDKVMAVDLDKEIIVIDDCSTDGSYEALMALKVNRIKLFRHERNMGKGMALRTGIGHASGNIIIIQDADLEYEPKDYHKLIAPIISGSAKVVYGSRILGKKVNDYQPLKLFYAGGLTLTFVTNLLYRTGITDEPTCYKVFDAPLLKSILLDCTGFEFCPEVTAKVARLKHKIHEVPISYYPRSVTEGKKIKFKDAIIAVKTLLKYRFVKKESFLNQ